MNQGQTDHGSHSERRFPHALYRFFALLAAGLGLAALLGWISELPLLTSFASYWIPMPPFSALLFVAYGTGLFFYDRMQRSSRVYRMGLLFGSSLTVISLLLLILSSLGIRLSAEHLGMQIEGAVEGASIGYISPLTTSCFTLVAMSFLTLLSALSGRKWHSVAAFCLSSFVVWISVTLVLAYVYGWPMFYGTTIIPPSLPTCLGFLVLGISLLISSGQRLWPRNAISETANRRTTFVFVVTFALLAASVITASYLYFQHFERNYRTEKENELSAIADLKMEELINWREDYLKDGAVLSKNALLSDLTQRYFDNPGDTVTERQLRSWLSLYVDSYHSDQVRLIDTQGVTWMSVPAGRPPTSKSIREEIPEVLRLKEAKLKDFYRGDGDRKIHLAMLVPILDRTHNDRPLGVLNLRIDPTTHLYPLIHQWPTPSKTAEVLLVRREGNDVLFLNDLRFAGDAALRLRFPLDGNEKLPAAKAVLGQEGIVEGVDYRGIPVVAAVRTIPNSPWFLVARMDVSEVYAPVRERMWTMLSIVAILLLGAGAIFGFAWRQRRLQFYRERYEAEEALRESESRFRELADLLPQTVYELDSAGRFTYSNKHGFASTGYTQSDIDAGLSSLEMVSPNERERCAANMQQVLAGVRKDSDEYTMRRKDGSEFPAIIYSAPILSDGRVVGIRGIVADISERKRVENALLERDIQFRKLSACVPGMIYQFTKRPDGSYYVPFTTDAIKDIFGCSPRDVRDDFAPIAKAIFPEDLDKVISSIEDSAKNLTLWTCEYRVHIPGKPIRWMSGIASPERMADGSITWYGFNTDITERKRAEEILCESESRYRELFDNISSGVAIYEVRDNGNDFVFKDFNKAGERLDGDQREHLIGKSILEARPGIEEFGLLDVFRRVWKTGIAEHFPARIYRDNRLSKWYENFVYRLPTGELVAAYDDVTERKQAEDALQESEARLRDITFSMADWVWEVNEKGVYTYSSHHVSDILGRSSEEVIGKTPFDFMPPEEAQRVATIFSDIVANKVPIKDLENWNVRKNGDKICLLTNGVPMLDEEGNLKGYRGVDKDITERKRAQEALLRKTEQLQLTLKTIRMGIWQHDLDSDVITTIQGSGPISGLHEGVYPTNLETLFALVHPEDRETLRRHIREATENVADFEAEFRLALPDGTIRWVVARGQCSHDAEGNLLLTGVDLDITERKRIERELEEARSRYQEIFEGIQEGIGIVDENETIVFANPAFAWIFEEESPDALIGRSILDYLPDDQRTVVLEQTGQRRARISSQYELTIVTQRGTHKTLLVSVSPRLDSDGRFLGSFGAVLDITDRKKSEEALKESEQRLRSILDATPFPIALVDVNDNNIEYWSRSAFILFGHTAPTAAEWYQLAYPEPEYQREVVERWKPAVEKARLSGQAVNAGEYRIVCSNGSVRICELYAAFVTAKLVVTFNDITERKLVEEALRESRELLNAVLNTMPVRVFWKDRSLKFLGCNEPFARDAGFEKPEDIIGKDDYDMSWREQAELYQGDDRAVIEGGHAKLLIEEPQTTPSGGQICLLTSKIPLRDATGAIVGVLGTYQDISERKRAEEELKQLSFRHETLLASVPDIIMEVDTNKVYTWANKPGLDFFGDDVIGKEAAHYFEGAQTTYEIVEPLFDGDEDVIYVESWQRRRDGEKRILAWWCKVRKDLQGNAVGALSTARDITEQRKAEEALRAAEERYRMLFVGAGEGIMVAQDGKIVLSNPALTTISGYGPEELSRQPVAALIHPEDREFVMDRYRRRTNGEDTPTNYDFRIVASDGGVRTIRINSSTIVWNDQPATLNFLDDVTAKRQSEDEIRKFKTISDNASYGTQIISPEATFLYVNQTYAEMHGYAPDELVGRHVSSCHTEQQMISVSKGIEEVLRSGSFTSQEVWHVHRNGTEFPTLMSGTAIRDREGQPQYLAATTVDITELKRLQDLADRAHRLEAAGRIAGQVAHDFNNLLGPLVAYPEIIREELGDGHPVNTYLEPIETAARQMAEINQQLLTLGRRGHYALEPLNLNEVIRQALAPIQHEETNLLVVTDLAGNLMNISGGGAQMSRVMTNLISNAVDAMQGIGTLTITSENWYADESQGEYRQIARGEYVKVMISDTGGGIPEDVLPHVFEPFFTTKKADRKRGSGLGLSVVHAVVEDHHGYIEIDSRAGKGTSVHLYFPITREEIPLDDETIASGGNESVLVVDDDAIQRDVTLRLLQKQGYRAEAVNCGEAALQRLQFESFDLLILDMVMPAGLDGADTYIRARELHPDQKAIIVSGFAESDRVAEALRMGAGEFLRKPLTLKALSAAVRRELDRISVTETPA